MTPHPQHPRQLARSKWTSRVPTLERCHWTVIEVSGDEVVLASVLPPTVAHRIPWRALRDRAQWAPGWI